MKTFYITTPIYYVNDKPHLGTAYTTIVADIFKRYHKFFGKDSYMLTGIDEHGQKALEAAKEKNMDVKAYCDSMFPHFKTLWDSMGISYDRFIRTTDDDHIETVQKLVQKLHEKGDIYFQEYEGWYCFREERFWTDKDLKDRKCPDCGRDVQKVKEGNYFFKMSKYQQALIDHINKNPDFICPEYRKNEVLGFLRQELRDLCISRPKERMSWGIELPFDSKYVLYVWVDALINYITGIGLFAAKSKFNKYWENSHHLIGKDILTTHAVYWPTLLMAMEIPLPKKIVAHGWWLIDETKMSKSLGNVVKPLEMVSKYGNDVFRYFLAREMVIGQDSNFSEKALVDRHNYELANDLGNLLNRTLGMASRYFEGKIGDAKDLSNEAKELKAKIGGLREKIEKEIDNFRLSQAVEEIFSLIRELNKFIDKSAPWKKIKENKNEVEADLYVVILGLSEVGQLLSPILKDKMTVLLAAINFNPKTQKVDFDKKLEGACNLFPKIEFKTEEGAKVNETAATKDIQATNEITISDFSKVELKVAKVLTAEKVEGADKLLKLQIDLGSEQRQIVAGIAKHYTPEELVGKSIIVVANLKKAKIRGVESHGMLLAAKDDTTLCFLAPDKDMKPGAKIS